MNTKGHREVADTVGIPLLAQAFGANKTSFLALAMGNWLTDVSQSVDPVAAAKFIEIIKDLDLADIERSISMGFRVVWWTLFFSFPTMSAGIRGDLARLEALILKELRILVPGLKLNIDKIAKSFIPAHTEQARATSDERSSLLSNFCRNIMLVKAYIEFVKPDESDNQSLPERMHYPSFLSVFRSSQLGVGGSGLRKVSEDRPGSLTQYYPHEHYDRPDILPTMDPKIIEVAKAKQIANVVAPGFQEPGKPNQIQFPKRPGPRSSNESFTPDLYSYLRDHIEMTAGLLTEVDQEIKLAISENTVDDHNAKWHRTLAKLGHSLHQVEDFFAHSNFVELVFKQDKELHKEVLSFIPDYNKRKEEYATIYGQRLKRYLDKPLKDWRNHEEEDWIVTGFFGPKDAVSSLHYVIGSLYEAKKEDRTFQSMKHVLDYLSDPKKALADPHNEIAKHLAKRFGDKTIDMKHRDYPAFSESVAREMISKNTKMRNLPKEIQDAIVVIIVEGSRPYPYRPQPEKGSQQSPPPDYHYLSLYAMLSAVLPIINDPHAWLDNFIKDHFTSLIASVDYLRNKIVSVLLFFLSTKYKAFLDNKELGSHSLIAKDHAKAIFYNSQMQCAKAVHWFIINTLLRWRNNPQASPIDWLALLEFFLKNPLPSTLLSPDRILVEMVVSVLHTALAGETFDSIADKYRITAKQPQDFTWQLIARQNLIVPEEIKDDITLRQFINEILMISGGKLLSGNRYTLPEGMVIQIPNQKTQQKMFDNTLQSPALPWFREVMLKQWEVIKRPLDEEAPSQPVSMPPSPSRLPGSFYYRPKESTEDQQTHFIAHAKFLREQAREAYRPPKEKIFAYR